MKKKCAAAVALKPHQQASDTQRVLFKQETNPFDLENWIEMPFFAQIVKEQKEQNIQMSLKFNLNFNDQDNLFKKTPETERQIREGKRANIEWTQIKTGAEVRWNSYEAKEPTGELVLNACARSSSILIRNNEDSSKKLCGKPSAAFENTPHRYTQATRDTNAGMSIAYDHPQMSDRHHDRQETIPFIRFSQSLFSDLSQSQLSSARDLPEMTNEYRLTKLRESKQF